MKSIFFILLSLLIITSCSTVQPDYKPDISSYKSPGGTEVFLPDSASIARSYEIPEWFKDAKFGVFIHWGVYAVPAFGNEWYPRRMYDEGSDVNKHHIETYGSLTEFGYKDFIPMFTAEKFDADEWLSLFEEAGIKYIVPVAEHHDGFSLYNSVGNKWNSVEMGPMRDIIGELKAASQEHGLHFGLSSHRAENAWFFNEGMNTPSDVQDSTYQSLYGQRLGHPGGQTLDCPEGAGFNEESKKQWLEHTYELIDLYQPELIWFDWTVGKYPFQSTFYQFMAYYYNNAIDWGKEVVVNTKLGYGNNIQVFDIERGKSDSILKFPWQTDTSIGKKSWGYIDGEENKSPNHIIDDLVDIVSKNGNLLLNIGPKPDGTITQEQQDVLRKIGTWLNVNGEAIYGTRPWTRAAEGSTKSTAGAFTDNEESQYTAEDIRFTTKGDVLYAISLGWSDEGILVSSIDQSLTVNHVSMLGSDEELEWSQGAEGLKVKFPGQKPSEYAHALKIDFK
ncbi:MAG: alpha-L-fucosidase [Bacteroides sp.]|nr:alpha-L-fucosidase [Bacteroides sp.]